MEYSPLVRHYTKREARWLEFLDRHIPDAYLLRWTPEHRVFRSGSRVMKVEWATAASEDPRLNLEYEFSLLEKLEGRALTLNPSYEVIDGEWHLLGIDWIEGEDLDTLIQEGQARKVFILQILGKLFRVSLAGVIYNQLRARHIIPRATGELVFIDFGGSSRANPLAALWQNFAILSYTSNTWKPSRLSGLLYEILRNRNSKSEIVSGDPQSRESTSLQRWQFNARRVDKARSENLANDPGDPVAAKYFSKMESCLCEAIQIEPRVCDDIYLLYFANYLYYGRQDWGFKWDHIARRIDFAGKRVIDLGCGMGSIGAFTRLAGGAHTISLDSLPMLLDAARNFALALGIDDNAYQSLDWVNLASGSEDLPKADIISALSMRLADLPLERVIDILAQYPEILWQTSCLEEARHALKERGYRTVEMIVQSDVDLYIIYATDWEV